jgi:hypothetical protein
MERSKFRTTASPTVRDGTVSIEQLENNSEPSLTVGLLLGILDLQYGVDL